MTLGLLLCALVAAPAAFGSFHLMKIRAVFPGSAPAASDAFVVPQMTSSGQNLVSGHQLVFYESDGSQYVVTPLGAKS